ncbi:hypothetical protein AK812_SmicGene25815, partial [Symbiodinium microadriaticum]
AQAVPFCVERDAKDWYPGKKPQNVTVAVELDRQKFQDDQPELEKRKAVPIPHLYGVHADLDFVGDLAREIRGLGAVQDCDAHEAAIANRLQPFLGRSFIAHLWLLLVARNVTGKMRWSIFSIASLAAFSSTRLATMLQFMLAGMLSAVTSPELHWTMAASLLDSTFSLGTFQISTLNAMVDTLREARAVSGGDIIGAVASCRSRDAGGRRAGS